MSHCLVYPLNLNNLETLLPMAEADEPVKLIQNKDHVQEESYLIDLRARTGDIVNVNSEGQCIDAEACE